MLFANAVSLLCASLNIGCYQYGSQPEGPVIRILSLTPFSDNMNEALSGPMSSATTQLQRKLKNPTNFGPNGIVSIGKFEFDDINLDQISNDESGHQLVRDKLRKADILYWSAISNSSFARFEEELITFVQREAVVLFMSLDFEWQNSYAQKLGYSVKATSNRVLHPSMTGPFGNVQNVQTRGSVLKITNSPSQAKSILKDDQGEIRGMQENTKLIFGDGNFYLNEALKDDSDSCQTNDQVKFACNVFGSLVEKVKLYKKPLVRITSLVPFSDNMDEALSGQYSAATTQLQAKLMNPKNFGPNGVVPIAGFDFDEIDLEEIKNDEAGRQLVKAKLDQTDILYWSAISNESYTKFYQELVPYVQQGKVILFMSLDFEWQNRYSEAFGYSLQSTSNRYLHPTSYLTGPFGSVSEVQTRGSVVKIIRSPPYAVPILEDDQNEIRGMSENTKLIFGDGNFYLNEALKDKSLSCQSNDQVKFVCNVFAALVKRVQQYKQ